MEKTETGFDFLFINKFQWLHLALTILLFLKGLSVEMTIKNGRGRKFPSCCFSSTLTLS